MSKTKILTLVFIAVVLLAIIIYDSIMAANTTPGDTISEIVLWWTKDYIAITICVSVMVGIILGHFFWPQYRDR